MKHQDRKILTSIKWISSLFVIAAILLVVSLSLAAGGGGTAPATAVTLDAKLNQGHLEPLEQHWFKFVGDSDGRSVDLEKTLTLIFTPKQQYTVEYVKLNIFEESQVQFFFNGDTSRMANLGAGSLVERDNNPETGELLWSGWIFGPKTYYVQVVNNSDFPVDYYLFNADVKQAELGQPETPPTPPPAAAEPQQQQAGIDPANPAPLSPDGLTKGKLKPGDTGWYTFDLPDPDNKRAIAPLEFTMFFTPDDGNRRHKVNFELFAGKEVDFWMRGDGKEGMTNFGGGQIVSRDGDYLTGERLWSGAVLQGDKYLLAITNGTDIEIDYYLFQGDIYRPELGPKSPPAEAKVFARGEAPTTAVPVKLGENVGHLNPGEQAWMSFFMTNFDNKPFEPMAFTMIMTPDDGNRIYKVPFDVFRAGDVKYWSEADFENKQITNLGVGSVVFRDNNPETGERFWNGWVQNNNLYLVQIRNGSDVPIDYHLFTGDVYRPELGGPKAAPVAQVQAAPGTERGVAFPFGVGVNKGSLKVGGDAWYSFSRADVSAAGADSSFTVVFRPNDGNRVYNVNVELYAGDQANSFGQGTVTERDQDPTTGELLWKGNIQPNMTYYLRVHNGADVPIDYWIFPEDVINANLQ